MPQDLAGSVIVHDRYQNYDSAELGELTHQLCCQHLRRDLDGAGEVHPDAHWPAQIADALRGLIHQTNLARETDRDAIEQDIKDELIKQFTDGVRVGLSDTTSHGNRPGQRTARLLLEVLRDREPDVLRFAHDLQVPPTCRVAVGTLLHPPPPSKYRACGLFPHPGSSKPRGRRGAGRRAGSIVDDGVEDGGGHRTGGPAGDDHAAGRGGRSEPAHEDQLNPLLAETGQTSHDGSSADYRLSVAAAARPDITRTGDHGISRFSRMETPYMHRFFDRVGSPRRLAHNATGDVAFRSRQRRRHPKHLDFAAQ